MRSGVARYGMEVQRLLDVLDQRLEGRDYIVVSTFPLPAPASVVCRCSLLKVSNVMLSGLCCSWGTG